MAEARRIDLRTGQPREPRRYTAEERLRQLEEKEEREWRRENPRAAKVHDAREALDIRETARRQLAAETAAQAFRGFTGQPLSEVLAQPREPRSWLIGHLQRPGHKVTLTAQFKAGKTTLSSNVVRALVDGGPLFGDERFGVRRLDGNVAVFDYELDPDDARDLYGSLGVRHPDHIFLESFRGSGLTLASDYQADAVTAFLREHDIEYLVLDPFGRAMRGFGSENANDDVRAFLDRVDTVVAEAGVRGVLLTAHTGRMQHEVGAEHARGATVLDDDADARWILTRQDEHRFFRAEGRSGIAVDEFALAFDPITHALASTEHSRTDIAGDRFRPHVFSYVTEHPGTSVRDIKAGVSGKDSSVAAALKAWVREGDIVVRKVGSEHRHYVAADAPEVPE